MAVIDLGTKFGLNPSQSKKQLKDITDIATARVTYRHFYDLMRFRGWDDAKFMRLSCGSAAHNEAVWSNHDVGLGSPCVSRIDVTWPEGDYWMNYPASKCMGHYRGQGAGTGYYPGWGVTCLHVWREEWLGDDPMEMCSMLSTAYKLEGDNGYLHGGCVSDFGFVGNNFGWYDPAYEESGLVLWDEAEASSLGTIWSSSHNGYGLKVIRGTPFTATSVISVFTNALGGVGLFDGEFATINLGTISGDDNPALVVQDSRYGRGAGGTVSFKLGKSESAKRTPDKGQIVVWQKSACVGTVTVAGAQMDMNNKFVDAAFVMNSRAWGQTLFVSGFTGWNFRTLVHDIQNQKRWAGTSYHPDCFVWASRDGGSLSDLVGLVKVPGTPVNASDRLGMVPNNGTFDYVAGTPKYSITGGVVPSPIACTGWTTGAWSAWSACVNGLQTRTRTVTTDPPGCSGVPPNKPQDTETQACTVVPVPGQEIPRIGWTASASHTEGTNLPGNVLDSNDAATSVWSTGQMQSTTGIKWVRIDMLSEKTLGRIEVKSGWNTDYPRKAQVYLTATTTVPTSGGVPCNQTTPDYTVQLGGRKGRYLWIIQSQDPTVTNYWFSISGIHFYAP